MLMRLGLTRKFFEKKVLVLRNQKSASGFKVNKECITILMCRNASGSHRLKLNVIRNT